MPSFEGFRNFSQGLLSWIIIAVVILGVIWLIISGVGNCMISRDNVKLPDIEKARYQVGIHSTGQILYTNDYEVSISPKNSALLVYTLEGYYEFQGNKYKYKDKPLSLDEYYWGDIEIRTRQ